MTNRKARDYALSVLATYDIDAAGPYEVEMVRIAKAWLSVLRAKHPVGGVVNRLLDELRHAPPPDPGCGWDDLHESFERWARAAGWIKPWS